MTDDDAVTYGREAAAVLGNRAYREAYEAVDRVLCDLIGSDITDEAAKDARYLLRMGKRYRKYLEKAMADGRFAAESIQQEEKRKKWWGRAA